VERLLDAGATLIGKTITDEVSLGILGETRSRTPLNRSARSRARLVIGIGIGGGPGAV
jgi:amidase